jgi:hypothetical protein
MSAFVRMDSPIPSRSAQGEMHTVAGRGLYRDGTVNSLVLRYLCETTA